jgi:hypothetical protein
MEQSAPAIRLSKVVLFMSIQGSDRELLEQLRVDVAVIKNKSLVLDKIAESIERLKENCRGRHEELDRAHLERSQKHEARLSNLETAYKVSQALYKAEDMGRRRRAALFWSAVVAVATSAQVLATFILHLLSKF